MTFETRLQLDFRHHLKELSSAMRLYADLFPGRSHSEICVLSEKIDGLRQVRSWKNSYLNLKPSIQLMIEQAALSDWRAAVLISNMRSFHQTLLASLAQKDVA